ncbi:MAG: dipeptidase [Parachlamydiales bacterium]
MSFEKLYDSAKGALLEDYFSLLRIPSVSADPEYRADVLKGADWVEEYCRESGLEVERWETPHYPVIFAQWLGAGKEQPTLLLYNHYDVQPTDPLEEWESPPFEPTVREGEVYARGAQDNKGQLIYTLAAVRALLKRDGRLPVNVKLLIEGEEESKSLGLAEVLESKREALKADYLVPVDFDIPSLDQPAVTLGLRGIAAFEITLTGSKGDLHSGLAGGVVYNPLHALTELLASLRDKKGRITVEGFYDDVEELSPEERRRLSLDRDYEGAFGALANGGERDKTPGESNLIRPTLEINGIWGGYTGKGFKTVIPAKAHAKFSCRLVPHQDPDKLKGAIEKHLRSHLPEGMKLDFRYYGGDVGLRASPDAPHAQAIAAAYTKVFGKPCLYTLTGGSVPITAPLAEASGAIPAFMGLGLSTDNLHAPNEHFGIERLRLGFLVIAHFLHILGGSQ